jgi:hypothetical protein
MRWPKKGLGRIFEGEVAGGCAYRRMGSGRRSLRSWLAAIALKAVPIATVRMRTINPLPSRIFKIWMTSMQRLLPVMSALCVHGLGHSALIRAPVTLGPSGEFQSTADLVSQLVRS